MAYELTQRQHELLHLLAMPVSTIGAIRMTYRIQGKWYVDYAKELPAYLPFEWQDVSLLVTIGKIEPTYYGFGECLSIRGQSPFTKPE